MKILFVQKVKALVGSEKYFLEIIPELEKRGIETEFICVYSEQDEEKTIPFIDAYKGLGLKIHVLKIKSEKSILKTTRFIKKVYNQGDFDLVHAHLIHADFWCALLKKFGSIKCPLVSTKHGYDENYISNYGFSAKELEPNRYLKLCRFSEKYIDQSFAVSEGLKNFFIEANITKPENISHIHHGFDLPIVDNQNSSYRSSKHQIVVLGRIIPFKGHKYLLEALMSVIDVYPDFKLIILGHGDTDLIDELKTIATDNNMVDNIEFKGYQSNIYDYLINSDLMVVPSIAEGFGLIFLEALNSKIPIIGFDVPATNEILVHEETGILIPPYDTGEMGMKICELLGDKHKSERLAKAGFERLKNHFSMDRMVSETIQFYQDSLS